MIELRAGAARVAVVPDAGGRLGALTVGGVELLVTADRADGPTMWGCFPMAPWCGRVRNAQFVDDGELVELPRSMPPHAAHGLVYDRPWARTDDGSDPAACALAIDLGPAWPFGGRAEQRFELDDDQLRATLAVVAGDRSMPAEVGWHPWFASAGPVELRATAMYERAGVLPTGRLVAPGPPPWDDCFLTTEPVRLPVGALTVTVSADTDHVVVFDQLDHGVAVEPQSGPPDAFHLRPRVLGPGERLERSMTIRWEDRPGARRGP